jgi:hypothetical protein
MSKWITLLLKGVMGLILGLAAIITTILLSPFLVIMWFIRIFNDFFDGENRPQ